MLTIIEREDLIKEFKMVMGMIDETEIKARMVLAKLNEGQDVEEEEVIAIEEDTQEYMKRLSQLESFLDF